MERNSNTSNQNLDSYGNSIASETLVAAMEIALMEYQHMSTQFRFQNENAFGVNLHNTIDRTNIYYRILVLNN